MISILPIRKKGDWIYAHISTNKAEHPRKGISFSLGFSFISTVIWGQGQGNLEQWCLRPITLWIIRSRNTCFIPLAMWDSRSYNRIKHLHVALAVQKILDLWICDSTMLRELILIAFWRFKNSYQYYVFTFGACTIIITCCSTSREIL